MSPARRAVQDLPDPPTADPQAQPPPSQVGANPSLGGLGSHLCERTRRERVIPPRLASVGCIGNA
jgi:hypothetical protein